MLYNEKYVWQVYIYATVDYATRKNHLNRITVFDTIVKEASLAHIKANKARIQFPFSLTDQGRTCLTDQKL